MTMMNGQDFSPQGPMDLALTDDAEPVISMLGEQVASQNENFAYDAEPEPTFDVEADREAGIDVDHPLYKRLLQMQPQQADADRLSDQASLDALTADLRAKQLLTNEQAAAPAGAFEYNIAWEGFNPTQISQDDPLYEHSPTIQRMIRDHVGFVMNQVNSQSNQMAERTRGAEVNRYLSEVIDAIGTKVGPGAKREALNLLAEHKDIALRAPEKWAQFVGGILGAQSQASNPEPARSAGAPDARQLAQSARGASQKPQPTPAVQRQAPQRYEKTSDAVEAALNAQLGRRR